MKRTNSLVNVLSAFIVFGFATTAFAQQAAQIPVRGEGVEERLQKREKSEDFKPRGARVGAFQVFPKLSIIEEYNDNIFKTASDPVDDFITTVNPTLKVNSDFKNHALNLNAGVKVVRFSSYTDDNVENYDVGVNGRIDVRRTLKVTLGASYKLSHEARGSPNAVNGKSPTETDTTGFKAGLAFDPGRLKIRVNGSFDKKNFDDVTTSAGTIINNDDRDRDEFNVSARIGIEYLPNTQAFIKWSYKVTEYDVEAAQDDNGEDRDSKSYSVIVGTGLDFTGITTGEVFIGWMSHDYDDANLPRVAGYTVGAGLRTKFTEITTGRLNIGRTIQETTTANVPGLVSSNATVRINHEFLRNFVGRIKGKIALTDYEVTGRKDYSFTGNTGVKYLFNRNFSVGLEYEFKARDSNRAGNDWTNNKIRANVGIQF